MKRRFLKTARSFVRAIREEEARGRGVVALGAGSVEELRVSLASAIAYQRRVALLPLGMAIAIFLLTASLVVAYRDSPASIAALFAASGLSLALPFRWSAATLRFLWRAELVAAALPSLSRSALGDLVEALIAEADDS